MHELLKKAGELLAKMINVEAAFVTAGAAAGLAVSTAACMTGKDVGKIRRLPNTQGMRNEVIIQRGHRNVFDQAYQISGAKFLEVGVPYVSTLAEVRSIMNEKTAAIAFTIDARGKATLEEFGNLTKECGIPLIVDAAEQVPPLDRIRKFSDLADLVVLSGGKGLGGPNGTGIICGKRELVEACAMNAFPNFAIGRSMKVSKEEIAGLVAAVDLYRRKDEKFEAQRWNRKLERIRELIQSNGAVETEIVCPDETGRPVPRLHIRLKAVDRASSVINQLKLGSPRVFTAGYLTQEFYHDSIIIDPTTLADGDEEIVGRRLSDIFSK
jgi:L-seryl-tRNA(Ser) seleniumtransferase